MQQASRVTPGAVYKRQQPERSEQYKAFFRLLPCAACGQSWGIEAAHTGPHGLGQKSSDLSCLPLCRKHHRTAADSLHALGPVKFAAAHQLDVPALLSKFNKFYEEKLKGPAMNQQPEACQNCGKDFEELHWQSEFEIWDCADCFAEASMILEAETTCPVLYGQVIATQSVAEIAELMATHECAKCSPRKGMHSAQRENSTEQGKVA